MGEDTNANRLKERDSMHNLSIYWGIILKWSQRDRNLRDGLYFSGS
jgi:hypothetical protein